MLSDALKTSRAEPGCRTEEAKAPREPWLRAGRASPFPHGPRPAVRTSTRDAQLGKRGRATALLCMFMASATSPGAAATPFKKALPVESQN